MSLYEIHVNLEWNQMIENIEWCKEHNMKYIFLFTPEAQTRNHFIVTKWKHGTAGEAIVRVNRLAMEMAEAGLTPTRFKVEGALSMHEDYKYAEFHLRMPTNTVAESDRLRALCRE